ncbi:MAG TPA: response regulator transcription factor [Desulfuromonadales bacterium]|nr:response regulator transcription factor [Desulfuromonadales bacterium]
MDRILVIDDDIELGELLTDYLTGQGFQVTTVHEGRRGAEQALAGAWDLIVLDVMLPGMDGFDVLRRIRGGSRVPVIMLTARGDDIDRIVGLELGADDYLPKPFNPRELVARIRAIQRRTEAGLQVAADPPAELTIGDITLCPSSRQVRRHGENLELTSVEFTLLEVLMARAGQVVDRETLVEKVLGRRLSAYDRSIDVHVSALRRKLGQHVDGNERIRTIRGVGYLYARRED